MSAVPRIRQAPRYRFDWLKLVLLWWSPALVFGGSFAIIWRFM